MNKTKYHVSLDDGTAEKLDTIADKSGFSTKNLLLAAAASQLAKVKPEDIYHALGRIAPPQETALTLESPQSRPALTPAPKSRRELAVAR